MLDSYSSLLKELTSASTEGLASNLARFLEFLGWNNGEVLELQALEVPRQRTPWIDGGSYVAHSTTLPELVKLLEQGQNLGGPGLYMILNQVTPAIADRYAPRTQWHRMSDRQGTSDSEILARRAVYIDLDADRPKGLSSVDKHIEQTFERAEFLSDILSRHIPSQALGWGHSGNGAALFIALKTVPCSDTTDRLVRAILVACKHLASDPDTFDSHRIRNDERHLVAIDISVSDRKRLCPAFGTIKAKGPSGLPHRPHRRTAFICNKNTLRLNENELHALAEHLRSELKEQSAQEEFDRAYIDPKAKTSVQSTNHQRLQQSDKPFHIANNIPIFSVLERLNLIENNRPICPGCRRTSRPGGMIEILQNGLKCSSNSCANEGSPGHPGFRTVIDVVMESQQVDSVTALQWLHAEFPNAGIRVPLKQSERRTTKEKKDSSEFHTTSSSDNKLDSNENKDPLSPHRLTSNDFTAALLVAQRRLDGLDKPIPVPFEDLAEQWGGGLWPGLHVLVSGTGAGKTTLALQIAQAAAEHNYPTLYIGLELEPIQIATRLLALETHVPWSNLYTAQPRRDSHGNYESPEAQRKRVQDYIRRAEPYIIPLSERPFYVDFGSPMGWPASRIRTLAEQVRTQHPPTQPMLVVLDFLQLVGDEIDIRGRSQRTDLRERIGRAAYLARTVAKDLNAAVLVISSVSREKYSLVANASSSDVGLGIRLDTQGQPIARTLLNPEALIGLGKESGEVEFAADTVTVMLRWPTEIHDKNEQILGRTGVVIASPKVRAGELGWCELRFNGSRFSEPDDRVITHQIVLREVEKQASADEKVVRNNPKRKLSQPTIDDLDGSPKGMDDF